MAVEDEDSEQATVAIRGMAFVDEPTASGTDAGLQPGTPVGAYRIDGELGAGAMGVVYAATHPVIGKRVAVKVLRDLGGDPAAVERFVLEARAVNAIGHRNIIDIFDFGALPDGRQYMVMDLLVGETLAQRVARGPIPVEEAAAIANECTSALAAAHAKGIVHRDLKPDNVFLVEVPLSTRPQIKVLDFGLVKLVRPDASVKTKVGAIVGTADYMSPEQGRGRGVDHRTDIYALGAVIYEMLTGEVPYPGKRFLEALVAHAEAPLPSKLDDNPAIPAQLAQLVAAMLAKDPEERPSLKTVRAVVRRFLPLDSAPPGAGTPVPVPATPTILDTFKGPGVAAAALAALDADRDAVHGDGDTILGVAPAPTRRTGVITPAEPVAYMPTPFVASPQGPPPVRMVVPTPPVPLPHVRPMTPPVPLPHVRPMSPTPPLASPLIPRLAPPPQHASTAMPITAPPRRRWIALVLVIVVAAAIGIAIAAAVA